MWAHAGDSCRNGEFPACRSSTWMIEPAERLDGTPTEPTYDDRDIIAFEPPVELKRFAWRASAAASAAGPAADMTGRRVQPVAGPDPSTPDKRRSRRLPSL